MTPRSFAPFLAFFLVANVLDLMTTLIGVSRGIPEGNPVMGLILAHYGLVAMDAVKVALVMVAVGLLAFLARRHRTASLFALVFGLPTAIVVILNVLMIGGLG